MRNRFNIGDAVRVTDRGLNAPNWIDAFKFLDMNVNTDNYSKSEDNQYTWIVRGILFSSNWYYYYITCPTTRRKLLIREEGIAIDSKFPKERLLKLRKENYVVKEFKY